MYVVLCVANTVIHKTGLPYFISEVKLSFRAKGEAAFDELHGLFQRDFCGRRQQQVEVVWHNHKFMQQKAPLFSIFGENINQELSHAIGLEKCPPARSGRGDKKCSR
jgi:hypothetical protein